MSRSDMASAVEAIAAAESVARLSREIGQAGAEEILAGRSVLAVSEDVASESLVINALSREDLEIGLALAAIAGQLQSLVAVSESMDTLVMARILKGRGDELKRLADTVIRRASAIAVLARTLAATSVAAADLGNAEMAEGEARLAVSEWDAEASDELTGEGIGFLAAGMGEAIEARSLRDEAERVAAGKGRGVAE